MLSSAIKAQPIQVVHHQPAISAAKDQNTFENEDQVPSEVSKKLKQNLWLNPRLPRCIPLAPYSLGLDKIVSGVVSNTVKGDRSVSVEEGTAWRRTRTTKQTKTSQKY